MICSGWFYKEFYDAMELVVRRTPGPVRDMKVQMQGLEEPVETLIPEDFVWPTEGFVPTREWCLKLFLSDKMGGLVEVEEPRNVFGDQEEIREALSEEESHSLWSEILDDLDTGVEVTTKFVATGKVTAERARFVEKPRSSNTEGIPPEKVVTVEQLSKDKKLEMPKPRLRKAHVLRHLEKEGPLQPSVLASLLVQSERDVKRALVELQGDFEVDHTRRGTWLPVSKVVALAERKGDPYPTILCAVRALRAVRPVNEKDFYELTQWELGRVRDAERNVRELGERRFPGEGEIPPLGNVEGTVVSSGKAQHHITALKYQHEQRKAKEPIVKGARPTRGASPRGGPPGQEEARKETEAQNPAGRPRPPPRSHLHAGGDEWDNPTGGPSDIVGGEGWTPSSALGDDWGSDGLSGSEKLQAESEPDGHQVIPLVVVDGSELRHLQLQRPEAGVRTNVGNNNGRNSGPVAREGPRRCAANFKVPSGNGGGSGVNTIVGADDSRCGDRPAEAPARIPDGAGGGERSDGRSGCEDGGLHEHQRVHGGLPGQQESGGPVGALRRKSVASDEPEGACVSVFPPESGCRVTFWAGAQHNSLPGVQPVSPEEGCVRREPARGRARPTVWNRLAGAEERRAKPIGRGRGYGRGRE